MDRNDEIDTTINLFDWLFLVRVPYQQSRSIEDIRTWGVRVSGINEIDAGINTEQLTTYMSVAKMVDYFKDNVPIHVVHSADIPKIYEFITAHITAWKYNLENRINVLNAPIEDLLAMDEFANTVYDHAKYQFTREYADSVMVKSVKAVHRFHKGNLFSQAIQEKYQSESTGLVRINHSPEESERESMKDFFKDRIVKFGRYRQ